MLKCKHWHIQQEDRDKQAEKENYDGKGGMYANKDLPCHDCGGKLSPHPAQQGYVCENCMEETDGTSIYPRPGNCLECGYELTLDKHWRQSYYCVACHKATIEQSRKDFAAGNHTTLDSMIDELAQSMGYKNHEDMELSIIREVDECGPECVWWKMRAEIIRRRTKEGKSLGN